MFVTSACANNRVPVVGVILANLWNTIILAGVDVPGLSITIFYNWGFKSTDAFSSNFVKIIVKLTNMK